MNIHYARMLVNDLARDLSATGFGSDYAVEYLNEASTTVLDLYAHKIADDQAELLDALKLMVSPITHINGCLWKNNKQMPCQCGFYDRINAALKQAERVIAKAEGKP